MSRAAEILPAGFAALEEPLSDYQTAQAVVVPLPYDGTVTYRSGTREGPAAIIEASQALELLDEELEYQPASVGIATLPPLAPDARGPEWMVRAVTEYCLGPARDGKFVLGLGGEHSVSVGCIEAQLAVSDQKLDVLQIDAHADLRDSWQNSPYSHACAMRRIIDRCRVINVGLRAFCQEEHDYIVKHDLKPFSMQRIRRTPDWIDQVLRSLGERVYLTIDLDGLDPSICPGVGTPEPGGLSWYETLDLVKAVFATRKVVAADLVECLPLAGQHATQFLAARLLYKMLAYRFSPHSLG